MTDTQKIALLPGDGIGPEVMAVATEVLAHLTSRFHLPIEVTPFPGPPTNGTSSMAR